MKLDIHFSNAEMIIVTMKSIEKPFVIDDAMLIGSGMV
jgi:hypothetical protein